MDVPRKKSYLRELCELHDDIGNNFVTTSCNLNKSLTIYQRNLQLLMIELFKTKNKHIPTFMKDIFEGKIAIIACEIQII